MHIASNQRFKVHFLESEIRGTSPRIRDSGYIFSRVGDSGYIYHMPILTLNNITKFYGPIQALNKVSLEVPEGAVFGILGPNGSGKTTMLGIVTDVLKATEGNFLW